MHLLFLVMRLLLIHDITDSQSLRAKIQHVQESVTGYVEFDGSLQNPPILIRQRFNFGNRLFPILRIHEFPVVGADTSDTCGENDLGEVISEGDLYGKFNEKLFKFLGVKWTCNETKVNFIILNAPSEEISVEIKNGPRTIAEWTAVNGIPPSENDNEIDLSEFPNKELHIQILRIRDDEKIQFRKIIPANIGTACQDTETFKDINSEVYQFPDYNMHFDQLDINNNGYIQTKDLSSVLGRSVVLSDYRDSVKICSTIVPDGHFVQASATFTGDITGKILFMQKVSTDPNQSQTSIFVNWYNHLSQGNNHRWYVHTHSVDNDGNIDKMEERCQSTGEIFRPNAVDALHCQNTVEGHAKCAVGDLASKHGNMSIGRFVLQDMNLPLYGPGTILDRSIVIYAHDSDVRIACATIKFYTNEDSLEHMAKKVTTTIQSGNSIVGSIVMQQAIQDTQSPTYMYVDLKYPDDSNMITSNYSWYFGESPVDDSNLDSRCQDIRNRFNPISHGWLSISKHSSPHVFVDSHLSISGPNSVVGRSFVIQDSLHDNSVLFCVTIGSPDDVEIVSAVFHGALKGRFIFSSDTNDLLSPTIAVANFQTNSNNSTYEWAIGSNAVGVDWTTRTPLHLRCKSAIGSEYPVSENNLIIPGQWIWEDFEGKWNLIGLETIIGKSIVLHQYNVSQVVDCATIGKVDIIKTNFHLNDATIFGTITIKQKFGAASSILDVHLENQNQFKLSEYDWFIYSSCNINNIHFEQIANLSKKYGPLQIETSSSVFSTIDLNFPLFGTDSIVGSSVVINSVDGNTTNMVCARLGYQAIAEFKGLISGKIIFHQSATPDPATTPTTVYVDLTSTSLSLGHKWHVHVNPVSESNCDSTEQHYNPFNAQGPCLANDPLSCELGDLSGKHGTLSFPAKFFFTDVNLPLFGINSISGRSVVIHSQNGDRLSCATIESSDIFAEEPRSSSANPIETNAEPSTNTDDIDVGRSSLETSTGLSISSFDRDKISGEYALNSLEQSGDQLPIWGIVLISVGAIVCIIGTVVIWWFKFYIPKSNHASPPTDERIAMANLQCKSSSEPNEDEEAFVGDQNQVVRGEDGVWRALATS